MTIRQEVPNAVSETDYLFSSEVILLDQETVIIDNLIALKYERLKRKEFGLNKTKSKRMHLIIPVDQEVQAWRGDEHFQIYPNTFEGDYKIIRFDLSAQDSGVQTGNYSIYTELVVSAEGHGLLLKIESSNPIARAIVEEMPLEKIAQGLTLQNRS